MLIKHLRDDFRRPFGTIVAVGPKAIGVSICSTKDHFDKRLGIQVAEGRARLRPFDISFVPDQAVVYNCVMVSLKEIVGIELVRMVERAKKYFKNWS